MVCEKCRDTGAIETGNIELDKKPTIPEILPLVKAYCAKPGNGEGGNLHIVLADYNIENQCLKFCLEWAREHNDADGTKLAGLLLRMSKTQRKKIAKLV